MSNDERKPLDDLVSPGTTYMLVTQTNGRASSRPLTIARIDGDTLVTLIDRSADWVSSAVDADTVHLTVSDDRHNTWLSLNGTATMRQDRAELDDLWNPAASAFFEGGKDDPNLAALHIDCSDGEYWDSPSGRIGSIWSMLKAKFGDADDIGDRGDVKL